MFSLNNKMTTRKPKIIKKEAQKPTHRLYFTFNEIKSAAIVLAREIVSEEKENAPADVRRFLDEFGREAA